MKGPLRGLFYLLAGARLLTRPGLRRFVLVPLLLSCLVYALLFAYAAYHVHTILLWVEQLPPWLLWIKSLAWVMFFIIFQVLMVFTFTVLANLLGGPFNAVLSQRVEWIVRGGLSADLEEPDWRMILREVGPALRSEWQKIWAALKGLSVLLILSFIPILNLVAPLLLFLFNAWSLAWQYLAYPMENRRFFFWQQRKWLRSKPWLVLSFGGFVFLFSMIPFINFLAMPVAVAGATVLFVRECPEEENPIS